MNLRHYVDRFVEILSDKDVRWLFLASKGFYNGLDDETYLKRKYFHVFHKKLHLDNPVTFNEKIQWLKLYDRRPEYTMMVDKYEVKEYIAKTIGEKYVIPTLGVWDDPRSIDFGGLPNQFVLKCTHNSGSGMYICRDKEKMIKTKVIKGLQKGLRENYFWGGREWPYKNVKPRIIAEKYMEEKGYFVPEDYKIYCMNGKPKYIVVFHNRFDNTKPLSETVYNTDWEKQDFSLDEHFQVSDIVSEKPECLEELIEVAGVLCKDYEQMRVDFYIIDNQIYFGEITLHTAGGFVNMIPEKMDEILGNELRLRRCDAGGVLAES